MEHTSSARTRRAGRPRSPWSWSSSCSRSSGSSSCRSRPTRTSCAFRRASFFTPTLSNYSALITGKLVTAAGTLDIAFMNNLWNSVLLSTVSVAIALILGVPAAYAFARFKFRLGEDIAFTLLSFRFAPPLLVLLPLSLYFQQLGLTDTYIGLIWVYQLIALPLILWIVRGYFEDISPDIEYAYRVAGHSWWRTFTRIAIPLAGSRHRRGRAAGLHFLLEQLRLRAHSGVRRQAAGHGRRARLRHRFRHSIWTDRRGDRALRHADARACALRPALSGRGPLARRGEGIDDGQARDPRGQQGIQDGQGARPHFARRRGWRDRRGFRAVGHRARRCFCGSSPASSSRTRAAFCSAVATSPTRRPKRAASAWRSRISRSFRTCRRSTMSRAR